MNTHTPKHFALQLSSLLTLYVSITALIVLLFSLINIQFPDAADYWFQAASARDSARAAIATLIVFFPAFLVLTRLSNQSRRKEAGGEYTVLAKWLVYLSLLVAGGVLLGNLVTLILYALNGEITIRFILKVIVLGGVVKLAGTYYWLDVRGYFKDRVQHAYYFAGVTSALVLASVAYGFMSIETPAEVREMRLDEQQVNDLQNMQWRIEEYYRSEETLPDTIEAVYALENVPTAPEDRARYRYSITGEIRYELCATFAHSSTDSLHARPQLAPDFDQNYNWEHGTGEWCFEREVMEEKLPVRE